MTPEQERDHLRAENTRLQQRIRGLEKTQDPTFTRRQAQLQGLDQAAIRLVQVQGNVQYPPALSTSGKEGWADAWRAGCQAALDTITDEMDQLMDQLYAKPEQLTTSTVEG